MALKNIFIALLILAAIPATAFASGFSKNMASASDVVCSGSCVSDAEVDNDITITALSDHTADTAEHGATGAVVGTTNTQTLTNKTFGSAVVINANESSTTGELRLSGAANQYITVEATSGGNSGIIFGDSSFGEQVQVTYGNADNIYRTLFLVGSDQPKIEMKFTGGTSTNPYYEIYKTDSSTRNFGLLHNGNAIFSNDITSTDTGDLGWSIVTGANTACTTTCTNAAVHGWDTSSGEVAVSASDATADKCLCAGAS